MVAAPISYLVDKESSARADQCRTIDQHHNSAPAAAAATVPD